MSNLISDYKWFYVWPLPIYSLISVPMYFYFVSTIKNSFKWKWIYLLLFIPFLLSIIDVIIVYASPNHTYDTIIELAINNPTERFNAKYGLLHLNQHYVIRHVWQFFALIAILPMLLKFIRSVRLGSSSKIIQIRWLIILYVLLFLMSLIASIYGIERIFNLHIISFLQDNARLIQVTLYVTLFLIAIIPISFPSILYGLHINGTNDRLTNKVKPTKQPKNVQQEPKYGLNIEDIKSKLEHIEKQEHFINPDFDLNKCAQLLDIPTHHLSHFLKQNLNLSFSSYRNTLRITKAKSLIVDGYLNLNTIDALALHCGFANRSSFGKVFKKSTGFSPGTYLQSIQNNN
ncbi:helix-turn-helix domain-containing protein [Kordia antarctica]|uniref:helix-turn-helix domain-containing protein n=1 Tax=Kordia antarctica TaxID=1218801 RepID=UPI001356DD16|nr:helix-turn-helix transcriptional regulator [Kordia antarctica]